MSVKSVTITGVDGFVGRHLARLAKERGLYVVGVSRGEHLPAELKNSVDKYFTVDLTEMFPAEALTDAVVHLAGLAALGPSFSHPQLYLDTNSSMVTHLCECILHERREKSTRVLAVSTGAVYGAPSTMAPIAEDQPIVMSSPYVVSKVTVENQISYYETRGVRAIIARPFNHIGPGQAQGFLVPDLWKKLSRIGDGEPLAVGNLDTARDYLDVRDVANAYLDLLSAPYVPGRVVNICSGVSTTGKEILQMLIQQMGIVMPQLTVDAALYRPSDALRIVGSAEKLQDLTGWVQEFQIRDSIRDFVYAQSPSHR